MITYCSHEDDKIYQTTPLFNKPSLYPAKGWTETVQGYLKEAGDLTRCILRNEKRMGRPYTWFVTMCVEVVQTPQDITDLWTKACRKLKRKNIVGLWVREPTLSNTIHYHILLKSDVTKQEIHRAFKKAMPNLKRVTTNGVRRGWHMGVRRLRWTPMSRPKNCSP
jgi:hypothetical protein